MKIILTTLVSVSSMLLTYGSVTAAQEDPAKDKAAASDKASQLSQAEERFVKSAAQAGLAEVRLGELGQKNAAGSEAKGFAAMMVKDHSKANKELQAIAKSKGIQLPSEPAARHQSAMEKLSKLSGAEFDKAFLAEMHKDHKNVVDDFEDATRSLKDPELKAFVEKTLPTLRGHLDDKAKELHGSHGKAQ